MKILIYLFVITFSQSLLHITESKWRQKKVCIIYAPCSIYSACLNNLQIYKKVFYVFPLFFKNTIFIQKDFKKFDYITKPIKKLQEDRVNQYCKLSTSILYINGLLFLIFNDPTWGCYLGSRYIMDCTLLFIRL